MKQAPNLCLKILRTDAKVPGDRKHFRTAAARCWLPDAAAWLTNKHTPPFN